MQQPDGASAANTREVVQGGNASSRERRPAPSRDANRITVSFKRNDFCYLLDALEAIIEDFKYDGGLVLAEDYIRLENRLRDRLRSHDRTPFDWSRYVCPCGAVGRPDLLVAVCDDPATCSARATAGLREANRG